ncbi:hypothetical protein U3516DRAFT_868905 [Neocallimastix sp. 'constans']
MEPEKKKIKRVTHACNYCKIKRIRCSGECPCKNCIVYEQNCQYSVSKKRESFSEACNYLTKRIPYDIPISNSESKYDVLINYELIKNLYEYVSFGFMPFLNLNMIENRINIKEIHFSVLFGIYAMSESVKPFSDYNEICKFKKLAFCFIEHTKRKNVINDIQLIEALYILSSLANGSIADFILTKDALKLFWMNDIYNLNCAEYKDDEEGKKNYISLVYASIIIKHMVAQVNTGLIEYVELTEPSKEKYINPILEDNYSFEKANEMFLEHINKCEKLPRYILINKLNKDKSFLNKININKFTGEIDINNLLLLKYNGHDVISTSTIRSLDFYMYMNQPTKWFAVTYNNISELRNTLFLFTNIINNNIKFNSSLLIEIDKEYAKFKRDMPQEFRFSNTAYRTDPPTLFLYKHKQKYWITPTKYMEMEVNEIDNFMSSCIYHQIAYILKNVISKSIDYLLNQFMYFCRLAKHKAIHLEKPQYYEFPSVIFIYEIGTIFLSKYVANHGIDDYNDQIVTFKTDIEELRQKLKNNSFENKIKSQYDIIIGKDIHDIIDLYYKSNMENKYYYCKYCQKQKKSQNNINNTNGSNNNKPLKTKEEFIELLKLLKYFYNLDEYIHQNCNIYKCHNQINNYLFTDSSLPTYQFFYDELVKINSYAVEAKQYVDNFKYLIEKAKNALNQGLDSFEIDTKFKNNFF